MFRHIVNVPKQKSPYNIDKMKNYKNLSGPALILVACFFACSQEDVSITPNANSLHINLLDKIPLAAAEDGSFSFVEGKVSARAVLEEILIQENSAFKHIDEFGFVNDAETDEPYLYIKEQNGNTIRTGHIALQHKIETLQSEKAPGFWLYLCVNEYCCDVCILSNGVCRCHSITPTVDCHSHAGANAKCKLQKVWVTIPR